MKWMILCLVGASALKMQKDSVYDTLLVELNENKDQAVQAYADAASEYQTEAKECHETVEQLKDTLQGLSSDIDAQSTSLKSLADSMATHKMNINVANAARKTAEGEATAKAKELAEKNQACAKENQGHRSIVKTFQKAISTYKASRNNDAAESDKRGDNQGSGDALLETLEGIQGDARTAYETAVENCNNDRNTLTEARTGFENTAREQESEANKEETDLGDDRAKFDDTNKANREDLAMSAEKQDEYQRTIRDCAADAKTNNFEYAEARSLSNQASYIVDMVENMRDQNSGNQFIQLVAKQDPLVDIVSKMLAKFPKDQALVQQAAPAAQVDRKNPFVNIMKIIEAKITEVHEANEKDKKEYAACETATREASKSRDGHANQRNKAQKNFHTAYGNFFKSRVAIHGMELQHARTMENFERAKYFRLMHNMENESLFIVAQRTLKDMEQLGQAAANNAALVAAVNSVKTNLKNTASAILDSDAHEDSKYGETRAGYIADIRSQQSTYDDLTSRFTNNKADTTRYFGQTWKAAAAMDRDSTAWFSGGDVHSKCEAIKITFEVREAARQQEIEALKSSLKAMQEAF